MIRNLLLAAIAALMVVFGRSTSGVGMFDWLMVLSLVQRIEVVGGLVVVALLIGIGWLLFQVMVQQGRLLLCIEALEAERAVTDMAPQPAATGNSALAMTGLPMGTAAPTFTLFTLGGEAIALEALRALGKPIVLMFSDPGCGPCNALLPEIGHWQREYASKVVVVLISRGTVEANRAKVTKHGLRHVLLQHDREVAQAYQMHGTPSAVLVQRDGTLGSPLVAGADAIRTLMTSVVNLALPMAAPPNGNGHGAPRPSAAPKIGEPAPDFSLPDLSGQTVRLSDFRGSPTLVLFWCPSCGFCQRMLPDLKAWEANPPEGVPRLLVVSTDSVESNQALGLRAPVLLDQGNMSAGRLFGATGTPMAVLVDAEGKIASELVAGTPAVPALAGAHQAQPSSL